MEGAFNQAALRLTHGASQQAAIDALDRTLESYGGTGAYGRDEQFSRNTAYPVDPLAKDYFDREVEALDTLSRGMARDLVTTILEGF